MKIIIPLSSRAYLSKGFDAVMDSFRDQMPEGFKFNIGPGPVPNGKFVRVYTDHASAELAHRIVKTLEEATSNGH